MTNEELVSSIKKGETTDENMTALYEQNRGVISMIAYRYRQRAELEDLMQEAYFGLNEAVKHFDENAGAAFLTYATFWIKQSLSRYCANRCGAIRIPEGRQIIVNEYRNALKNFTDSAGELPTISQIAEALGWKIEQVMQAQIDLERMRTPLSTSHPIGDNDSTITLEDTLADPCDRIEETTDKIYQDELRATLWPIVDDLPGKEGQVLRMRYADGLTLEETGQRMNLSHTRIKDIETGAIKHLQSKKRLEKLRGLCDADYYDRGIKGTGLTAYQNQGTSSTEKAALYFCEIRDREERNRRIMESVMNEKYV